MRQTDSDLPLDVLAETLPDFLILYELIGLYSDVVSETNPVSYLIFFGIIVGHYLWHLFWQHLCP